METPQSPIQPSAPAADGPLTGITCVIPAFNECEQVEETLRQVHAVLASTGRPFEIILVDDGSTDGTGDAALKCGIEFRLQRNAANIGYGASIKAGVRRAAHPWILITDADGTYPPAAIPALVAVLGDDDAPDMVVGQRNQTRQTDGFFRLRGKAILMALANFLTGMKIPDLNSGLRIMRKSDIERYWTLLPDGFSLTTTITLALLCSGELVRFVPIEYQRRKGNSKIRPMRDMWNFTVLIVRTMIYFNPLKVFLPLAAILVALSFAVVILSKVITHAVMDVTANFLFDAGMQMLMIGIVADLILKVTGMRKR